MTPNAKHSAFFLIVFLLIAVSCIKEEVGNIEEGIVITPFYSLPIGSTELLFDEIVDNPGLIPSRPIQHYRPTQFLFLMAGNICFRQLVLWILFCMNFMISADYRSLLIMPPMSCSV
jgi:hypothetical protein